MQIVYLNFDRGIPVLGNKGGSVHVRSVVAALSRLGHDVTVLCSTLGEGNPAPPARLISLPPEPGPEQSGAALRRHFDIAEQAMDDNLVRREVGVLAHDVGLPARALAALAAHGVRPDAIYERHALFHVAGIEIAETFGVPRILEVNAPLAEEQERFRGLSLRALAVSREIQSWRGASLAVAVSEDVATRLRAAGVAESRIFVGQNGIDTSLFHRDGKGGDAVRQRLNLGDDPVLGFVGSFKAWHGVDFLIDVFARLRNERPRLRLLAVGEGPLREASMARTAALGLGDAVVFTGAVPHAEVPAHLAAMDLTVAPYMPQPDFYFSPLKVIESLAAGRPVVAPRIGQIETLVADGVTGLLYPPGNADACGAAITRLLEVPGLCGRLGSQAAVRARQAWDWTALVGRVLDKVAGTPALQEA